MSLISKVIVFLVLITMVAVTTGGGGHGSKHVHLKIHVPDFIKHHHHTKTVYIKVPVPSGHGGGHGEHVVIEDAGHHDFGGGHDFGGHGHGYRKVQDHKGFEFNKHEPIHEHNHKEYTKITHHEFHKSRDSGLLGQGGGHTGFGQSGGQTSGDHFGQMQSHHGFGHGSDGGQTSGKEDNHFGQIHSGHDHGSSDSGQSLGGGGEHHHEYGSGDYGLSSGGGGTGDLGNHFDHSHAGSSGYDHSSSASDFAHGYGSSDSGGGNNFGQSSSNFDYNTGGHDHKQRDLSGGALSAEHLFKDQSHNHFEGLGIDNSNYGSGGGGTVGHSQYDYSPSISGELYGGYNYGSYRDELGESHKQMHKNQGLGGGGYQVHEIVNEGHSPVQHDYGGSGKQEFNVGFQYLPNEIHRNFQNDDKDSNKGYKYTMKDGKILRNSYGEVIKNFWSDKHGNKDVYSMGFDHYFETVIPEKRAKFHFET